VGVAQGMATLLGDYLLEQLRDSKAFGRVVGSGEVETLIGFERQKQMMDCDNQSCLAEVAGMLGVDFLLTGSIGKIGNSFLFNVKLLNARNGTAAASVGRKLEGTTDDALVDSVHPIVVELLQRGKFRMSPTFAPGVNGAQDPAADPAAAGPTGTATSNTTPAKTETQPTKTGPSIPMVGGGIAAAVVGVVVGVLGLLGAVAGGVLAALIRFVVYVPTPGLPFAARQVALVLPSAGLVVLGVLGVVVALGCGVAGAALLGLAFL
jgi:hypothetical protein